MHVLLYHDSSTTNCMMRRTKITRTSHEPCRADAMLRHTPDPGYDNKARWHQGGSQAPDPTASVSMCKMGVWDDDVAVVAVEEKKDHETSKKCSKNP